MAKLPKTIKSAVQVDIRFVVPVRAKVHADGAASVRLQFRTRRLRLRLWTLRAFVWIIRRLLRADAVTGAVTPVHKAAKAARERDHQADQGERPGPIRAVDLGGDDPPNRTNFRRRWSDQAAGGNGDGHGGEGAGE